MFDSQEEFIEAIQESIDDLPMQVQESFYEYWMCREAYATFGQRTEILAIRAEELPDALVVRIKKRVSENPDDPVAVALTRLLSEEHPS